VPADRWLINRNRAKRQKLPSPTGQRLFWFLIQSAKVDVETGRTGNRGTVKYRFFCEKKYAKEAVIFTLRDFVDRSWCNEATELRQTCACFN